MSSLFNDRNYRIVDILCLVMAMAIWQFRFASMIHISIGLVLPSVLLVWARWGSNDGRGSVRSRRNEERAAFISFYAILFAIVNGPFGFEDLFERIHLLILILIVAFIFKPTIEFISGVLFSFWISYVLVFVINYLDGWKGMFTSAILDDITKFTNSGEGISTLVTNYWWIYFAAGCLFALLTIMSTNPQLNNRFLVIGGVVAFPVLVVGFAGAGAINGMFISVRIYVQQIVNHFENNMYQAGEDVQPAKKNYLFHKAFIDWKAAFQQGLKENTYFSKLHLQRLRNYKSYYGWITFIYYSLFSLCAIGTIISLGTLWIALASFVQMTILLLVGLPLYILSAIVWSVDRGYRRWKRVQMLCPSCHHLAEMPIYVCSKCSAEHTRLVPGSYGIFKRKCQCGRKLPAAFFNGRANLEAKCPSCHSIQHGRESMPLSIPIIGGPSVGKTCFMLSATRGIFNEVAPRKQWNMGFLSDHDRMSFESLSLDLLEGHLPSKTVNGEVSAFNFLIANKKWQVDKLVYFYDPAGESFQDMNSLKNHTYYQHNHGNVFIIDPFSIAEVSSQYELERDFYSSVNPSDDSLEEIYDRMIIYFQEALGVKPHQKITKPIAFVINKVDAYNLDQRIGEKAAREAMAQDASIKTIEDAIHQLCIKLLSESGMKNFLRKVDDRFSNYRFFASSSIKDSDSISAKKPLLWVLSQADKDLSV